MTVEEIEKVIQIVLEKMLVEKMGSMAVPPQTQPHPDHPLPAQEFYSIKNCVALTGLSPKHIRRAVLGGTLIASDVGTVNHPLYRISRPNLLLWMKERENGAKPPAKRAEAPLSRHHKARKSAV